EFVLTVAWLLAALRPSGPYPVKALTGEQGSAKSMRANFLRGLVDPNSVPLRAPPLRKVGIDVAFDRENRQRKITITPAKVSETPSLPSPLSFSNSLNDLEETACRHRAVTDEEATVTGDGSGSNGDGGDRTTVTANPLKNNESDGSDGGD